MAQDRKRPLPFEWQRLQAFVRARRQLVDAINIALLQLRQVTARLPNRWISNRTWPCGHAQDAGDPQRADAGRQARIGLSNRAAIRRAGERQELPRPNVRPAFDLLWPPTFRRRWAAQTREPTTAGCSPETNSSRASPALREGLRHSCYMDVLAAYPGAGRPDGLPSTNESKRRRLQQSNQRPLITKSAMMPVAMATSSRLPRSSRIQWWP